MSSKNARCDNARSRLPRQPFSYPVFTLPAFKKTLRNLAETKNRLPQPVLGVLAMAISRHHDALAVGAQIAPTLAEVMANNFSR
jgi:hypothetical protein